MEVLYMLLSKGEQSIYKKQFNFSSWQQKVSVAFWFRIDDTQALGMQVVWFELTVCLSGSLEGVCLYFY